MANIKIAQLTNQTAISDNDLIIIETATSTNKMTVGTLKELLGLNIGLIVESGSNSNGSFVKYADGTLVTYSLVNHTVPTNDTNPATGVLTFPSTFISPPILTVSNRRSHAYSLVYAGLAGNQNQYPSTSSYQIQWRELTAGLSFSAGTIVSAMVIAIGRWK